MTISFLFQTLLEVEVMWRVNNLSEETDIREISPSSSCDLHQSEYVNI